MKWGDILWGLMWPPAYTFGCAAFARTFRGVTTWRSALRPWFGRWLAACFGVEISAAVVWYAPEAGIGLALAAGAIALWWWLRRKRRDPAARSFGAKSRARIAALVRKAREVAKPKPSLRPAPGGAA